MLKDDSLLDKPNTLNIKCTNLTFLSSILQECVTTHLPNELALKMDGKKDIG